eukprot:5211406-Alexandrium_andersonii.AAC.1
MCIRDRSSLGCFGHCSGAFGRFLAGSGIVGQFRAKPEIRRKQPACARNCPKAPRTGHNCEEQFRA